MMPDATRLDATAAGLSDTTGSVLGRRA